VLQRAVLTLVAAGVLVAAGQPAAVAAPEVQPPDKACWYHKPDLIRQQLSPADAAKAPWAQQRLRYEDAWRFGRGEGQLVAVVDSGVDAGQRQLRRHVRHGGDLTTGTLLTRRKVLVGGDADCFGHGTAVAGMIAAQPLRGVGMVGVAPDASVLPIRESWGIDSNGGEIRGQAFNLYQAILTAIRVGAKIINVSVTLPADQLSPAQQVRFQQLAKFADQNGALIVAAVGNKSQNQSQNQGNVATYPAALSALFDNVIAVGGIGSDGRVDPDSITGPFVTVAAPGQGLTCTPARLTLVPCSGTSFAAPFVSGLAALLRSRFPGISPAEVKRRIELTADHPSTDLPDPEVGYGVINPVAAMTAVLPGPGATPSPAAADRPLPPPVGPDTHTRAAAVAVAGGAVLLALVVAVAAAVLPLGRRRRWRPGRRPDLPAGSPSG
jgi:type VII secretion-associated serine protease mycosin